FLQQSFSGANRAQIDALLTMFCQSPSAKRGVGNAHARESPGWMKSYSELGCKGLLRLDGCGRFGIFLRLDSIQYYLDFGLFCFSREGFIQGDVEYLTIILRVSPLLPFE